MLKSNKRLFAFFWLVYFFLCPYCEYKDFKINMIYGKFAYGFSLTVFLTAIVDQDKKIIHLETLIFNRFMKRVLFLFAFCNFLSNLCYGQLYLADVEFDKVGCKEVEDFVHEQIRNNTEKFTDVKPSLEPTASTAGFRFHEREYLIKDSLLNVWMHYVQTNPSIAWNASRFSFGMLFSKNSNQLIYPNGDVDGIDKGQIIYLNLNVLKIKKLATAFEITTVNDTKKVIEFSYVEDNITHGKQQLLFSQTRKGFTKIIHCTYFKSQSALRDHFLYPYFHTRLANTYHRNMKHLLKQKKTSAVLL